MEKYGNIIHIGITAIVGFFFFLIGQFLYPVFSQKMWSPLGIALYFLLFAVVFIITMFVLNQARRDYSYWIKNNKKDTVKKAFMRGIICIVILFILSGVFEFLYELGKVQMPKPTSYVFLIDDSGSMAGNDPECKRSNAIEEIMKDANIPYTVYKFTDSATLLKSIGMYSTRDEYHFESDGNTNVLGSLGSVINDIINDRIGYGQYPKVLLLSDGDSSKYGLNSVVKNCTNNGIVVSTIGFNIESNLLQNIARKTGGIYLRVDDVANLQDEMNTAITSMAERTLISDRFMLENNALYGFLRTVFLILLGLIWSWLKYETFCSGKGPQYDNYVLKLSIICCTISAPLMEIMFSFTGLPAWINRLIFCVLWSITPGYFVKDKHHVFAPKYEQDIQSDIKTSLQDEIDVLTKNSEEKTYRHTLTNLIEGYGSNMNNDFQVEEGFGTDKNLFAPSKEGFGVEVFGDSNSESGFGDSFGGFGE